MLIEICFEVRNDFLNNLPFIVAGNNNGIFYSHVLF